MTFLAPPSTVPLPWPRPEKPLDSRRCRLPQTPIEFARDSLPRTRPASIAHVDVGGVLCNVRVEATEDRSYLGVVARVRCSVRSLTATISMSAPERANGAKEVTANAPKPWMPTRTAQRITPGLIAVPTLYRPVRSANQSRAGPRGGLGCWGCQLVGDLVGHASKRRIRTAIASFVSGGSCNWPSSSRLACRCSTRRAPAILR